MKYKTFIIWFIVLSLTGFILGKEIYSLPKTTEKKYPLFKEFELFADVLTIVQKSYVKEVSVKDLIYGAIKGVVNTLDPHSQFLTPEAYKDMKIETEGEFGGLGIEITVKDGYLTIVTPLEGTPAYKAGLKPNDRIIKIDGKSTEDINLNEAVQKLRGEPGSTVELTVMRKGKKEFMEFSIERDYIKLRSIKDTQTIEDGIGYIRITQFQDNTTPDFNNALEELSKQDLKGLIIDLRNNPGGLLQAAVDISEIFISEPKLIVSTKGRLPEQNQEYKSNNNNAVENIPLVVLINKGSASGSEIFAGAVKDWKRGILIGTQTFGKGSVQSVLPLRDGSALKLTTATYYTPLGNNIDEVGIKPNIEIQMTEEEEDKLWESRAKKEEEKKDILYRDSQLERAIDLLKGLQAFKEIETAEEKIEDINTTVEIPIEQKPDNNQEIPEQ